ncbi:DNA topoisomerase 3 [Methylobacter sp. BlB1]|uniref:DNA topoisomerase 3 n=1 Tax=Methylobacter sp. BlB1 TaxID=2785914 RepID=UPI0018951D0B|nr:DNA topoisomerase 3 [Methylobacter sp. BlB1]MBF6649624.1 DNA topoisomerase 3 [Methylobacter sp. BlB1]
MKVILTEKPSVARDIARCLNIRNKRDGYFEGNGYRITWAFGHLVELKEPDDYHKEWKRWSLEALPIIPEKFGLKARGDASAKKQLNTIKHLFKEADEIICATDAGREGELIFRYILSWSQCLSKPFKRLWISSLTDEAIRKGFAQLQDGRLYDNLYRAAKCRSESDWIVGLNATRLYTLKFGQNCTLWTIGRVQTPVLALIVQRDAEIANFIPKDFWELQTLYRNTVFQYAGGRFDQQVDAEALLHRVDGHPFQITAVKGKQETVNPPLLYDLTDLQKDMSMRYGFTADRTLTCAQQLYEKKHITYPRTDSRYLSTDMKAGMKPLLEKLRGPFGPQIAPLDLDKLTLNARYFNNAKVTDHHAIIPTTTLPGNLSYDEEKLYQAIAIRFIAAFYPPCIKQVTTVQGETNQVQFKTTGTVIVSPGWQALYKNDEKKDKEQKILPEFMQGETGPHQPSVSQGKTTPPKPYTEAALLSMMESAGKTCDDETLKEALKEKGLGTPATRAAIIETLIKRGYIERQKKNLLSTESGRHLIAIIADDRLKSAAMTGEWESKLKKIEQHAYDPDQFMAEIIQFTQKIKDESTRPLYDAGKLGACPLCHKPVIEGRKGYGCSGWKEGCQFVLWKEVYGVPVTHELASQLLQNGRTLQAYKVHVGDEVFNAQLTLNAQGEAGYIKAADKSAPVAKEAIAACPLCSGQIIETPKAYSCSEWRNGCKAVIWKTIAHKKITAAMAKKMIATGQTGVLKGFKSAKGSAFDANLKFVDGKVQMDFSKPA